MLEVIITVSSIWSYQIIQVIMWTASHDLLYQITAVINMIWFILLFSQKKNHTSRRQARSLPTGGRSTGLLCSSALNAFRIFTMIYIPRTYTSWDVTESVPWALLIPLFNSLPPFFTLLFQACYSRLCPWLRIVSVLIALWSWAHAARLPPAGLCRSSQEECSTENVDKSSYF